MMATINDVREFVDTAERNRKYPPATAQGLRVAIKLFDAELNEDERASLDRLEENIEQIYQSVYNKNKANFTAASLATYRARITKAINDFKKYGTDPSKLANWTPKVVVRAPRRKNQEKPVEDVRSTGAGASDPDSLRQPSNMHNIELALRPDAKFVLVIPRDLRQAEVTILTSVLGSLAVDKDEHGGQKPASEGGNAESSRG